MSDHSTTDEGRNIEALVRRGAELCEQGRFDDALREYRKVLQLQPDNIQALFGAAWIYRVNGDPRAAAAGYQRVIQLQPNNAEAYNALGAVYHENGGLPEAVNCYQRATALKPDFIDAHNNLGGALQQLYLTDQAVSSYRRAFELHPGNPAWELRIASLCRPVARSCEESDRFRSNLLDTLGRLAKDGFHATPEELVQTGVYPSYSLMYHGRDDRPIREAYARLFKPCFPESPPMAATGERRIGMVVTRTHEGLFIRSMGGILRHIDTTRFNLTVVCTRGREHFVSQRLNCPGIRILPMPESITACAQALRDARFDILYYWEIATDPLNYFLPYFRLAPVQCTSWGIQVTSGIPTVDYYLSSTLVEPRDAQRHYTETLICADTLLTYQYRSTLPDPAKQREDFGLRRDQHVYLFTQQMGKFHPDFDPVVGRILRRDPHGVLVILQGMWPYTAEQLHARLSATIPDVIDRVVFMPRLDHDDLLCLVADAEALLDPLHYGGVNSSYDGFSMNVPIVTCESPYHIGRYTAGCYRKMGLEDCIAANPDAYVDMAVELGTNPQYRAAFSQRIREASPRLYRDEDAVREHERLFDEMLGRLPDRH